MNFENKHRFYRLGEVFMVNKMNINEFSGKESNFPETVVTNEGQVTTRNYFITLEKLPLKITERN